MDGFKAGTFKLRVTRDLLGYAHDQIKRVRVVKRADGYYAQFGVAAERRVAVAETGRTVGIDLGLAHFNRRLAKSISDAGWRAFVTWLGYLAQVYGKIVVAVPPAYTSQECSGCGERVKKALSERTHVCPRCTAVLDRDHNAARNIMALGLRRLEETTAGHAESHAWGQSALYPMQATVSDTAAG